MMVLLSTLLEMTKRQAYVDAVVVLCVSLSFVGVRTGSPSPGHHQPTWTAAGNRTMTSEAGSTFEAMLARRNYSVLTAPVGRSIRGRSIVAARSHKKKLHLQSPGVATSGASSERRVRFSLRTLGMAIVNAAQQHRRLP